jgi:hypothetical protein
LLVLCCVPRFPYFFPTTGGAGAEDRDVVEVRLEPRLPREGRGEDIEVLFVQGGDLAAATANQVVMAVSA